MSRIYDNGIYRDMTDEELKSATECDTKTRINGLKQLLSDTDYKAIKYAEGLITDEEYQEIRKQRIIWREEINRLEVI